MSDVNYGLSDMSYGLSDESYGLSDGNYVILDGELNQVKKNILYYSSASAERLIRLSESDYPNYWNFENTFLLIA